MVVTFDRRLFVRCLFVLPPFVVLDLVDGILTAPKYINLVQFQELFYTVDSR